MQQWLLDEPASNLCSNDYQPQIIKGMLERGKFYSNAAIATALAVSDENQINSDSETTKLSLYLSNERFACNLNNLYAIPRTDLHEIEWIEADSLDAYVSRFIAGLSTITRNNLRKCCRTSTSSGYSSHSLPLLYSCYTSAVSNQNFFRGIPLTMKDQFNEGLAIIHESEAIPRPIWPTTFFNLRDLYQNNENSEYDTLYTYCGCGCAYTYSYCDWDYEKSINLSAHEVLLELSQTLDSMIEGKNITPEEILQNISYQIAQGIDFKGEFYEYVYHNSSFLPGKRSFLNDTNPYELSCNKNSSSKINPVNSKLYNTRNSHLYNPWYTCLCTCERTRRFLSSKNDQENIMNDELKRKENLPLMFLMDNQYQKIKSELLQNNIDNSKSYDCKCLNHSIFHNKKIKNVYMNRYIKNDIKETININEEIKQDRNKIISNNPEYSKQLEYSDGDSFNKDRIFSSNKNNWNYRMQGFAENLDFTLDVSRAEHLGHVIAKAKRKRQWCRILTAFFGLVFFILSVVIVSLSVTKGRKVFGIPYPSTLRIFSTLYH